MLHLLVPARAFCNSLSTPLHIVKSQSAAATRQKTEHFTLQLVLHSPTRCDDPWSESVDELNVSNLRARSRLHISHIDTRDRLRTHESAPGENIRRSFKENWRSLSPANESTPCREVLRDCRKCVLLTVVYNDRRQKFRVAFQLPGSK